MKYKFITIEDSMVYTDDGKRQYSITNNRTDDEIGQIYYYKSWKKYIFLPLENTVWDEECLRVITTCLENLNRKKEKAREY